MTDSSSQVSSTRGVRTSASWTARSRRASRSTSWADGGSGGRGGRRGAGGGARRAAEHELRVAAAHEIGDVRVALAHRLGLDRAAAEAVRVEVSLERPADEQRRQVEGGGLLRGVDDRAHGGRKPNR